MTRVADYKISVKEFNEITEILEKNGFKDLAEKYRSVAKSSVNGEFVSLGSKDRKIKPLVDFVIAPFKFAWNTITLPYNLTMKVVNAFVKKPKTLSFAINDNNTLENIVTNYSKEKSLSNIDVKNLKKFIKDVQYGKIEKDAKLSDVQKGLVNRVSDVLSLARSIENIGKEAKRKNLSPEQFKTYVNDNILKAFNDDSMSNVSNSELSNLAKTAASIATIWFLMTDNYNMVMLKSNGNDVEGAKTKFTERFVQEGSRLFYQTLLIDLFNSTFRNSYNASLLGMSWVTLTDTTLGEMLTRKSVGTALKAHTRDELIAMETEQNNSTGFKKKYYDFMQRLTGKRSIKSYEVAPHNNTVQQQQQEMASKIPTLTSNKSVIFKQNNETLEKMMPKSTI
jgi:fumarate reductase subunit C